MLFSSDKVMNRMSIPCNPIKAFTNGIKDSIEKMTTPELTFDSLRHAQRKIRTPSRSRHVMVRVVMTNSEFISDGSLQF